MRTEQLFDCPWCRRPDKPRLYVNAAKGQYYCQRCKRGGWARDLPVEVPLVVAPTGEEWTTPEPQPQSWPLTETAREYVEWRGPWRGNPILECEEGLLFPFPRLEYWQVRRWQKKHRRGPWRNARGPIGPADGVLYLAQSHPLSHTIVLVEGIFDALSVARVANAAAVLSFRTHPAQAARLVSWGYHRAVLLPDSDVSVADRARAAFAVASVMPVRLAQLPGGRKDPGEATEEELVQVLQGVGV